jgi:MFS family permease
MSFSDHSEAVTPDRPADARRGPTATQWKSGLAAWLGLAFDGMDAYLYILVAAPFVAELLGATGPADPRVGRYGSYIQAGFLLGWAVGGIVFGRIGDRLGRSRTMSLTILTYASCTGLSALAQTWWHLLILRFLAAMGIGGEWAAGAALVSETWPRRWRAWTSPLLMSSYECGMLLATLTAYVLPESPRGVFAAGVLPALVVFWIRRALPETDEWRAASAAAGGRREQPSFVDLFRGPTLRTTLLTVTICSMALTITWMHQFWGPQYLRSLPDVRSWSPAEKGRYVSLAVTLGITAAIPGNFFAAWMAHRLGDRKAVALMFLGGLVASAMAYSVPRDHVNILYFVPWVSFFTGGVFGVFPLYVPPLFPTLLRTTGAGFSYNIGRVVAAVGTVVFGLYAPVGEYRVALLVVGALCLPAMVFALFIPESPPD